MARYIDVDKFTERIKASPAFRNVDDGLLLQRVVIDILNNMPAADVAPKSEVAREIFEEIEKLLITNDFEKHYGYPVIAYNHFGYAELKKKYTEDQNNENQNQT